MVMENKYIIYSKTDKCYVISEKKFTEEKEYAKRFDSIGEAMKTASTIMQNTKSKDYQVYQVYNE